MTNSISVGFHLDSFGVCLGFHLRFHVKVFYFSTALI